MMAAVRPRALMFRCGETSIEWITPESRYIEQRRKEGFVLLADETWLREQAIEDARKDDERGAR
jgi:hypothetical protein